MPNLSFRKYADKKAARFIVIKLAAKSITYEKRHKNAANSLIVLTFVHSDINPGK